MTDAKRPAECWVCAGRELELAKPASPLGAIRAQDFAITDSHYGRTGTLWRCRGCGFLQCGDLPEVLGYYEALEDPGYEASREPRALQAQKLLETVRRRRPSGRLLDVGAGSGILVERALALGYRAEGVEPSRWLQAAAQARGLPVALGTLSDAGAQGPYDVVTLIDVLEHVDDPLGLLRQIRAVLAPDGVLALVTPDVGSAAARLLGWRWWHFRVAHIGYFDRSTLARILARAGFAPPELSRPAWYFGLDYLLARVNRYLPRALQLPAPRALARVTLPLNLRDSLLAIAAPQAAPP